MTKFEKVREVNSVQKEKIVHEWMNQSINCTEEEHVFRWVGNKIRVFPDKSHLCLCGKTSYELENEVSK